ncbi:helix-turn-helix domain-containing protein [Bacillus sp. 1P06AnD]|uniref:helix-turn-helix domain-containing protein n=1 Tax=Bacillus sp. 1P06AnD TaxID=3132208 RepID=UPI00399FD610
MLSETFLHPIRIRIIQLVANSKSMTVGSIADSMDDIPRSTIYRHVKILSENNVLIVVKEEKVRGTYEREYAFNYEMINTQENQIDKAVLSFLLKLFFDFNDYFKTSSTNPVEDKIFLSKNTLLLSDDEFEQFKVDIYDVIKKYLEFTPQNERKERNISIISSPVPKEE